MDDQWFRDAIAVPTTSGEVVEDGARIRFRQWGSGAVRVLLVHGAAAHNGWWDHIAPSLGDGSAIVGVDLSGHGESDHRDRYDIQTWAREVVAVLKATTEPDRCVVVAHSLGGQVALTAAADPAAGIAGVIGVDSAVVIRTAQSRAARARVASQPTRVYPTREAAVAMFRPFPAQDYVVPYVLAHVAEKSIRPVEGGWTWKFDSRIYGRPDITVEQLPLPLCPVAIIRAEHGIMTDAVQDRLRAHLGDRASFSELAGVGHHAMLDSPRELISVLQTLLHAHRWGVSSDG